VSPAATESRIIGLIVNPIAGMGGRVGLKGTDGEDRLRRARELGAEALAPVRAGLALDRLLPLVGEFSLLAAPGEMGESVARGRGIDPVVVGRRINEDEDTGARDTRTAAIAMAAQGAELILFAGGDGTARVILEAVGTEVPVVGVPTGVKMHSGCFARNPAMAGDVATDFLMVPPSTAQLESADVVDRIEDADGVFGGQRLFGSLRVPRAASRLLGTKSQSSSRSANALEGACREIVESMTRGTVYVLGPGSTTGRIRSMLGIDSDPLAVDVIKDRRLVAADVSETELIELVADGDGVEVIVGVIGGQGSVLGRGNQQISPAVMRNVPAGNVTIVAGLDKLISLGSAPLSIDTGDPEIDSRLAGHRPVRIGRQETLIYQVAA